MLGRCSAGSVDSTTDSRGLGFDTRSSVRAMLGGEESCESGSLESPSTTTYALSPEAERSGEALTPSPDAVGRMRLRPPSFGLYVNESPTLQSGRPPSICSVEVSPAKTSQSPDAAPDSPEANDRPSSSSSPAVQTSLFQPEGGSSSRTYPDYFPAKTDEILPSYSRRWPSSGFTTSPGECWTADTSESPNAGAGSSSLADVLQDDVPSKYFLSPRAAAGILRRVEKRGRALPSHLLAALEAVARTTTTDRPAE
jgi:hypothetical protein